MPRFKDIDIVKKIFQELKGKEMSGPALECVRNQLEN